MPQTAKERSKITCINIHNDSLLRSFGMTEIRMGVLYICMQDFTVVLFSLVHLISV